LWRISVPDFAKPLLLEGDWFFDWAGAQRFFKADCSAEEIFSAAASAGGHATCYSPEKLAAGTPVFQPVDGISARLQSRLRDSFDEQRLFNRGRFHPEFDQAVSNAFS